MHYDTSVCQSLTKTKNRSCARCYLHFIRLIFLFVFFNFILFYGTLCFAFCICRPLETHRGDKSKCSSSKNRLASTFHVLHTRETPSALTSRSPTPGTVWWRLRKRSAPPCRCATGPKGNNPNSPGTLSSVS